MSSIEHLQEHLEKESPGYHWLCLPSEVTADGCPKRVEISAMHGGKSVSERPLRLSVDLLDKMGIDAATWLICHELTPARAGVDWDKLAEI